MKRLHLVLLVCVALMPAMPVSTAQTPDSDAPYLYYYSESLNAYVIERADGTDSRIFGEGILDPDTDYLTGPGWSPSGEWFAVKADNRWNPEHKHSSMILNVNGEERMIQFDEIDIRWMEWARTVDILIASTAQWNEVRQTLDVTYFLVDVNNNQVIREFTFATDSNYTYQLTWLSNPDQFVISYTNPIEQADSFIISTIHGEFTTLDLPASYNSFSVRSVSSTSWILWEGVALNLLTFDIFVLPEGFTTGWADWSPDGQRAIIYCGRENDCLIDVVEETIRIIEGDLRTNAVHYIPWSQDGRYILKIEGWDRLFIYDVENDTWSELLPGFDVDLIQPSYTDRWTYYSDFIVYHGWDHVTDIRELHVYDGVNVQTIFTQFRTPNVAYYSHDARYIGLVHYGAVIREVSTWEDRIFLPNSGGYYYGGSPGGNIIWHPMRNWFISTESFSVFDGGSSEVMIVTGDAETGFRRELFECQELNPACVGWLPENVDVNELPAPSLDELFPLPEPVQILDAQYWINALSWSIDGEYLQIGDYYPYNNVVQITDWTYVQDSGDIEFQPSREYLGGRSFYEGLTIVHDNGRNFVVETGTDELVFDIPDLMVHYEVSPDGKWLVGGAISGDIEIWSLETGTMVNSIPVSGSPFAFSPDGTKLAAGVSWEVWIWDVEDLVEE